ncbi:chemotaxis protein [Chitinibacteraceae bacterium HSL-7]
MSISTVQGNLLESVDARTKLAGSNKMEILLFTLGSREIFGINVFKVREVSQTPRITKTPNMPAGVEGVISLRGNIIPVIALNKFVATQDGGSNNSTMIVTEFSKHTQAFLVHDVDRIIRVDWDKVRAPESMLAGNQALITALTELPDGKLVSILDVEQILASVIGEPNIPDLPAAVTSGNQDTCMFFVDDSMVARKEIVSVLDKLGVKYFQANNGKEAWDKLQSMANRATQDSEVLRDKLKLVLVDAEMPEMDGYVLTKHIKSDVRFAGIPVVMHSSLSSNANRAMGASVGVDAYVAKFDPVILAETLTPFLSR